MRSDSPYLSRNMWMLPLLSAGEGGGMAVLPLHEALADGRVAVGESHQMESLRLDNQSGLPVLGIDGLEILGGCQNRILNRSTLLAAGESRSVATLCVEAGRWGDEVLFAPGRLAYPSLRSEVARGRTQADIWSSLTRGLETMRVHSATSSMHDLYRSVDDEVRAWAASLPTHPDQVGSLVVIAGRFLCGDAFVSPALFRAFWPLLAESYCVEGLLRSSAPGDWQIQDLDAWWPRLDAGQLHRSVFFETA